MTSDDHWAALACVRLASIFYRSRAQTRLPNLHFQAKAKKFKLSFDGKWLERHPLTAYTLEQECSEWSKVGFDLQIVQSSR
jgi:exopolyphosphatase/guanosine-5'-triphosphate,3'-diphosphate pyrophosphatase